MSLWSYLFGKRPLPSPPRDLRDNSDNWQVGDMALCVNDRWETPGVCPRRGALYRVTEIWEGVANTGLYSGSVGTFLGLDGLGDSGWGTQAFRRLRPKESEARNSWQNMLTNPQEIDA